MPPKKTPAKKTLPKKKTDGNKEFAWSDYEAELLLNVTNEYKVAKAAESVDWESVKSKYKDIFDHFVAALPEQNIDICRNFPHKKEEIKLQNVTSKLKAIRLKFRQAVDSGCRSGHGRVVMIFYELCEQIWGGSPATEQIDGGIETVELIQEDGTSPTDSHQSIVDVNDSSNNIADESTSLTSGNALPCDEAQDLAEVEEDDGGSVNREETDYETVDTVQQATVRKRRELLDEKLKTYKQDKMKRKLPVDFQMKRKLPVDSQMKRKLPVDSQMKRKLPVDSQMLGCAQEELAIKRRLVEQVDKMDQKYAKTMDKMSQNMEKLTSSIADGFTLQPCTIYKHTILMDLLTPLLPECRQVITHLAIVIASLPVNLTTFILM